MKFVAVPRTIVWVGGALLLLLSNPGMAQVTKSANPYAYNGGSFSVTVTFKAFSSFEFDGANGGDIGNLGWLLVSNLVTGRSTSFTYLQSLTLPELPAGGTSSEGQIISGTLTVDPDVLGAGPLTVQVLGVTISRPFHPSRSPNNIYGEYVVTTLVPTNVQADLPPYRAAGQGSSSSAPGSPERSAPPTVSTPANIHAVIISGLSDPAKVITSPNVTVTGGIVALGKDGSPPPTPSPWSPGLRIVPDRALLTGEKIPPVTPNILDVRIVRQEVTADFPSPNPQPSN
jgi:hypothetical protein